MPYVFMSFGSHVTGLGIGCCIVEVDDEQQANDECIRLDLMPNQSNQAKGWLLDDESFPEQGMDLNRFYSSAEMDAMGFEKDD